MFDLVFGPCVSLGLTALGTSPSFAFCFLDHRSLCGLVLYYYSVFTHGREVSAAGMVHYIPWGLPNPGSNVFEVTHYQCDAS